MVLSCSLTSTSSPCASIPTACFGGDAIERLKARGIPIPPEVDFTNLIKL
jgi:hypothetical protein